MNDRKPRRSEIRVAFEKEQILTGMNVAEDGTLTFFGKSGEAVEPSVIEVGKTYNRPTKSPKVLTRSCATPSHIQLDSNRLLTKFAFLAAVDTNTIAIDKQKVSISAPVLIRNITIDQVRWSADLLPLTAFECHDAVEPPERIGWYELIDGLSGHPEICGSIGIVVDSELDDLAQINSRSKPLLGDFFLPSNFELLYGCGDRGTAEFIANAAIADCDRTASHLLARLEKDGFVGEYYSSQSRPHGRFRYWYPPGTSDGAV